MTLDLIVNKYLENKHNQNSFRRYAPADIEQGKQAAAKQLLNQLSKFRYVEIKTSQRSIMARNTIVNLNRVALDWLSKNKKQLIFN